MFEWEGRDRSGRWVRGQSSGAGENQVLAALLRRGIKPDSIRKRRRSIGQHIKPRDIAVFTRQMATLLKAGVPLLQAFDVIGRGNTHTGLVRLISEIRSDVETGTALNAAFRRHPKLFNGLYCTLVEAGETAGVLDTLLERLAGHMEKVEATKSKMRSVMMYPLAVLIVAGVVLTAILVFVIPSFKDVFLDFGASLPAPTQWVITLSGFVIDRGPAIGIALGMMFYGAVLLFHRSERMQQTVDRLLLKLPVYGRVVKTAVIARWTRTLATMFAAGVPLVEALHSAEGAAGNWVYSQATRKIRMDVSSGTSITDAMSQTGIFPPLLLQLCAIGEESGTVDRMLDKVASMYEQEVDDMVAGLSSLLEPVIMVVLGLLIGAIVVSMYLPVFKLGQVI
ncbi:MAG: type II secretion system F family protein [Hydrogenophaga sp.]